MSANANRASAVARSTSAAVILDGWGERSGRETTIATARATAAAAARATRAGSRRLAFRLNFSVAPAGAAPTRRRIASITRGGASKRGRADSSRRTAAASSTSARHAWQRSRCASTAALRPAGSRPDSRSSMSSRTRLQGSASGDRCTIDHLPELLAESAASAVQGNPHRALRHVDDFSDVAAGEPLDVAQDHDAALWLAEPGQRLEQPASELGGDGQHLGARGIAGRSRGADRPGPPS